MHRLERHILGALIRNPHLRYADLKPPGVEGNLFMYHLKRLTQDSLIRKAKDGGYELTPTGKLLADKMQLETLEVDQQPRIVLLLAVRSQDKGWLLHRRSIQPVINMVGFLHANMKLGASILDTAATVLERNAGLRGKFKFRGSGTISIYQAEEIESYITFYLLEALNPSGQLIAKTDLGSNFWQATPDFGDPAMLPSMKELCSLLKTSKQPFFRELTYHL